MLPNTHFTEDLFFIIIFTKFLCWASGPVCHNRKRSNSPQSHPFGVYGSIISNAVCCFPLLVDSLGPKNLEGTKYGHCIFKTTVINILFFLSLKGSNFGYWWCQWMGPITQLKKKKRTSLQKERCWGQGQPCPAWMAPSQLTMEFVHHGTLWVSGWVHTWILNRFRSYQLSYTVCPS